MATVTAIKFPILYFSTGIMGFAKTLDEITICKKGALKNGFFDNLLLIDIDGIGFQVKGARKITGVGLFCGYNIFLNQTIKVELMLDQTTRNVSIDEVKNIIFRSFEKWHGWKSRGDLEELKVKVKKTNSIANIITLLSE
jgi:hypothetical protein